MHNRMPSRKRPPGAKSATQGQTVPVQGETQDKVPRQPDDRDESADSQAPGEASGKRIGAIAHDDLAEGQVDTDKGPVLDAAYDKVREGASDPEKKFRP